MSDSIRICRVCSVEHKIQRHKVRPEVGICPICEEYHALYPVVEGQPNQGDKRASDLVALRAYDRVLASPPDPSPEPISPRQQRILDFIRAHIRQHHNSPSIREIGAACDISSTSVVNYNLDRLQEKGYITRELGQARTIRVRRTPAEFIVAIAELLEDIPPPETPEEIDAELRAFGYDPVEVGRKMEAVARRALATTQGSVS